MSAPAFFGMIFLLAILGAIGLAALIMSADRPRGLPRRTKNYISELETTVDNLLSLAYDHKSVDPGFADIVIDEVKTHRSRVKAGKMKELE